ncbi:anti-sigma factor [Nocardia arthritidis]|nr:anti-sigma factor [Nocardia arthritidis]
MLDGVRSESDLLELAYPYALDAVADIERRHIESRLDAADPEIRQAFGDTVRTLHEVLARLAVLDELTPPARLEARILAMLDDPAGGSRTRRPGPPEWRRRLGAVAPIAAAVLLVLGGGMVADRFAGPDPGAEQPRQITDMHSLRVLGGGTMTVDVIRPGLAAVMFDGVAPPPDGHIHQLWLVSAGGRPRSIGMPAELPSTARPFVTKFKAGDTIAVTVEPAGGSQLPTTSPLAGFALP